MILHIWFVLKKFWTLKSKVIKDTPIRVVNDSTNETRELYWDEENQLMVLSDNGRRVVILTTLLANASWRVTVRWRVCISMALRRESPSKSLAKQDKKHVGVSNYNQVKKELINKYPSIKKVFNSEQKKYEKVFGN